MKISFIELNVNNIVIIPLLHHTHSV